VKEDNFDLILAIPCDRIKKGDKYKQESDSKLPSFDDIKDLEIKNPDYNNELILADSADVFCKQIENHRNYEMLFNDEANKITIERNPVTQGQVILYKDEMSADFSPICRYNFFAVHSELSVKKSSDNIFSSLGSHIFDIIYFVMPDINYHDLTLLMDQSHELLCSITDNKEPQIFMKYLNDTLGYKYFGKIYHIIFSDYSQFEAIYKEGDKDGKQKLFNILASEEYKEDFSHQIELSGNTDEYIYSSYETDKDINFSLTKKEKFYDDYNMYSSYRAFASIYSYYYVINEEDKDIFEKRISPDPNNEDFSSEANILFVLETEIFKVTACLVSSMKINEQINNPDMVEIQNMFKHFIDTRPLFEKLNYRYLGAQKEADFINKQFRISDMLADYDRKRDLLKNYCEVSTSIVLNRNSKILNWIGVFFALIAGWDTLALSSRIIFDEHKITWKNELLVPVIVCLVIFIVLIKDIQPIKKIRRFFEFIIMRLNKWLHLSKRMRKTKIVKLKKEKLNDLHKLFYECYKNDPFYAKIFSDTSTRNELLGQTFSNIILYCLSEDGAYGVYENKQLIAFLLFIDYQKTKRFHIEDFENIFIKYCHEKNLPYKKEIHDKIDSYGDDVIYLLSVGVSRNFRKKGIAGKLIDFAIEKFQDYYLVGDVSNISSVPIYVERNFECKKIDDDYFLITRKPNI